MKLFQKNNEFITKKNNFYIKFGKRAIDLIIVFPSIIILSPIFIVIMLLISIDSEGSPLYKQERVGQFGKAFYIYKFRTMLKDADKLGPKRTSQDDNRITKTGKFLRRTSLDELPQLFNVLKGDMSLVGYRPGVYEDYPQEYIQTEIFKFKPGISGYAQINGRSNLTQDLKLYWEKEYTKDISFKTDLMIIIKTILNVLDKKDVN